MTQGEANGALAWHSQGGTLRPLSTSTLPQAKGGMQGMVTPETERSLQPHAMCPLILPHPLKTLGRANECVVEEAKLLNQYRMTN